MSWFEPSWRTFLVFGRSSHERWSNLFLLIVVLYSYPSFKLSMYVGAIDKCCNVLVNTFIPSTSRIPYKQQDRFSSYFCFTIRIQLVIPQNVFLFSYICFCLRMVNANAFGQTKFLCFQRMHKKSIFVQTIPIQISKRRKIISRNVDPVEYPLYA